MDLRLQTSLIIGKALKTLISKTGGGGTAAPGLASLYLDPKILKKLSPKLERTIIVTGTNGKTTTTRLIGDFFESIATTYIHNRHGSNLERGLVSALLANSEIKGRLKAETALFEIDEAALSSVITKLSPKVLVITNLFRDQLDRYGEVDNIRKRWELCLENLDSETTLVLNADDPSLVFLATKTKAKVIFFGLDDQDVLETERPLSVDSIKCPVCYGELKYKGYYISHQGEYRCLNCKFEKPKLQISARNIKLSKNKSEFQLHDGDELSIELTINIPGLYNIYNCLASYAALKNSVSSLDNFPLVIRDFKPVFGRSEKLSHQGREIIVALAKNPTGFNEILRTYLNEEGKTVLVAINDKIADGRDVSWLWDVNFESIENKGHKFIVSGLRASDMALRLKYAGLSEVELRLELEEALDTGLAKIPQNDTLIVIPTYTAMLQLKKIFADKGFGGEFWED